MTMLRNALITSVALCAIQHVWPIEVGTQSVLGEPDITVGTLGFSAFTTLRHELYPRHAVRVKKTKHCDGEVNAYSGYVDVEAKHLWFELFESRNDPATDDFVFWTNGGPGCSSAIGLYMEHGPCLVLGSDVPKRNPYSWNERANVLYIHQPVNVGFSYAEHGESVGTSEEAGLDVAAFISILFDAPEFAHLNLTTPGRKLHLAGESYGGRYIPLFAAAIVDENVRRVEEGHAPVHLESIMIANGVVNWAAHMAGMYDIQCTAASGLMPTTPISTCVRMKQALPRCIKWLEASCINAFDELRCPAAHQFCSTELLEPYINAGRNFYDISKKCEATEDDSSCYAETMAPLMRYLSLNSTQELLGVDPAVQGPFKSCSAGAGVRFLYSLDYFRGSYDHISALLERGVRVLVYNGDYDFCVNWSGSQRWTEWLDWSGAEAYRATALQDWLVDGSPAGKWRGAKGLTFATVHAAGHMAPFDKPKESLAMLQRWLDDKF